MTKALEAVSFEFPTFDFTGKDNSEVIKEKA